MERLEDSMARTTKTPDEVAGVKVSAVKAAVLDKYLTMKKLGMDGTLAEKIVRMGEYIREKGGVCADCETCGGECQIEGPETYSECPYCGDGEMKDENGNLVPPPVPPSAAVKPTPAAVKPPVATAPAAPLRTRGSAAASPPQAVQKPGAAAVTVAGLKALETAVARVKKIEERIKSEAERYGRVVYGDHWELGNAVYSIYKDRLYTQRMDPATQQTKYKNWNQFVLSELGMSPTWAYKLMDVAYGFTKEDVEKFGVAKLAHVVRLPEGDRKLLLTDASKALPVSAVAKQVQEQIRKGGAEREPTAAAAAGGRGVRSGTKATKAAAKKKQEKLVDQERKVTVATLLGRQTIPLFAKGKDDKRAKRIADEPVGREEVVNGVVCAYRVVLQAAGLVLIVERRREG